ncbi:hypothetical protein J4G02_14585 [Candidatus Poribacteria bacterium]|nr:hypothetical protein [Candidatus Poribacteria bacterium]
MSDDLVILHIFPSETEANIVRSMLDAEGISAALFKDDAGGMHPHLQPTRGVTRKVRDSELKEAQTILAASDN